MKQTEKEIKEFLVMILDKEMEEEWATNDEKDFIANCIEAKKWLIKDEGIIGALRIEGDIEKYIKEEQ